MRRLWTLSGVLATAMSLGILGLALRPSAASPLPSGPAPAIAATLATRVAETVPFLPRGAGSCAAAACHGSATPLPAQAAGSSVQRNEHTVWIDFDPHAQAYDVLNNDRSRSIARNLGKSAGKVTPAHLDNRCLACHATPTASTLTGDVADTIRRDGVGCESCHGPSSGWLSPHTTIGWDQKSPAEKGQYGFNSLSDLPARAQVCTGCHVGAPADPARGIPARDVNHDLIAAGHPRLNFEFSAFVANYPKHWKPKPAETRDLDIRLWKIGQAATLIAAMDLLQDRCQKASAKSAPWPELSEYSCFSCHFALKDKPFRGFRDPGTPPGVPSWASWYVPLIPVLAKSDPLGQAVASKLATLRATMSTLNPDPAVASAQAAEARAALSAWLPSLSSPRVDAPEVRKLVTALTSRDAKNHLSLVTSWDSAAQLYLALAAAHASQGQLEAAGADPNLRRELDALLKDLGFPKGFDSPRNFDPSKVK